MIYRNFKGLQLSALGFGTMRLPTIDGDNARIDENAAGEMFDYAIEHGVNYFDTAWGYHGGQSEISVGKLLSKYPRESFYLASKFPGYDRDNLARAAEIFEKQLEKCRVEYFDFYLAHTVSEQNIEYYLDPQYAFHDFLASLKASGKVRHLGFSVHASLETTKRFLDAFGDLMEFCQVQLNWIDWEYQKACDKVELLAERNIPVWVMEPLRGGKLANLEQKYVDRLAALRPDETVPAWSFRYLQTIPGVTVTLSGMSDFNQIAQNIKTFETDAPLNEQEMAALYEIASNMTATVPCTTCRYCVEKCPMELKIPELIKVYNDHLFSGRDFAKIGEEMRPSACIACRGCEEVCPQQIKISEVFADFNARYN